MADKAKPTAGQVFFFDAAGRRCMGMIESFPLNGGKEIDCLVIQPEQGGAPTRVAADSDEAAALKEQYSELDGAGKVEAA